MRDPVSLNSARGGFARQLTRFGMGAFAFSHAIVPPVVAIAGAIHAKAGIFRPHASAGRYRPHTKGGVYRPQNTGGRVS